MSGADMLASTADTWKREPIVVAELPAAARPIFARWYAELALVNDAIGKGREAEYCRSMAAQMTSGGAA